MGTLLYHITLITPNVTQFLPYNHISDRFHKK